MRVPGFSRLCDSLGKRWFPHRSITPVRIEVIVLNAAPAPEARSGLSSVNGIVGLYQQSLFGNLSISERDLAEITLPSLRGMKLASNGSGHLERPLIR
jgi:hypothetical protein